jgi:hypothetical protein
MARVEATAEEIEMDGDHTTVSGLLVTCSVCGHAVEVFGTSEASARRAGAMLANECPQGARNFYVVEEP